MKIKKYISSLMIGILILGQVMSPGFVLAQEAPTAPEAPEAPSAPEAPTAPEAPEAPSAPEAPTAPEAPEAPSAPTAPEAPTAPTAPTAESQASTTEPNTNNLDGTSSSGNVGDTTINTGDASTNGSIINTGNDNLATNGCCSEGGASVKNSENGAGSVNQGSASLVDNNGTSQTNSATVKNEMDETSNTGGNDTNYNVGNSSINTGDANTTGTVITSINTNVDGIAVSEFNIVDDHVGDIILDFGANCIAGCGGTSLAAENSGNGAYSYNDASATSKNNENVDQTNIADVGNDLTLVANSGYNDANFNTGGDSNITTGDANVSANAITFANNNIAGDVIYGVVNIFGDLIGDIILTEDMMNMICGGSCLADASAVNTGNGAGSVNVAETNNSSNTNIFQNNDADITNTLVLDATTGDNDANYNTGGNSSINTGSANIDANVLNIANMNLTAGDMWLVIVNEAGNWVGKLYGAPSGGNVAASALMSFLIDPITGGVTATNSDNGSGSVNQANTSNTTNTNINQNNTATINNNLNLTANTGGNTTNYNTGGDSNITTGDANIVANVVNFVNNNIVGDGKLVVTMVNVFGSWLGDFLTPGSVKEEASIAMSSSNTPIATNNNSDDDNKALGTSTSNGSSSGSNDENSNPSVASVTSGDAGVRGTISNIANQNITNLADDSEDTLVAGIANVKVNSASKMNINLAWLTLLIPVVILVLGAYATRKVYLIRKTS